MKKFIYPLMGILCFCFNSCSEQKRDVFDLSLLDSTQWIYHSEGLPDSIEFYSENYLEFRDIDVKFNNSSLGIVREKGDTLEFIQVVNEGTKRIEKSIFKGIVLKCSKDTLQFKRLSGYFPLNSGTASLLNFDQSKIITFVNVKSLKAKKIDFDFISLSTSDCYGTCPIFSCEINSKGKINYFGRSFTSLKGNYSGTIDAKFKSRIEKGISYLDLKQDTLNYPIWDDAQMIQMLIGINGKTHFIRGTPSEFSLKMQALVSLLFVASKHAMLRKSEQNFNFKTKINLPPEEKSVVFLPPIVVDY